MDNHHYCTVWYYRRSNIKPNSLTKLRLDESVSTIPLVGKKYQQLLQTLGIVTIKDLIYYFPRDYFDSSKVYRIADLNRVEKKTFIATVDSIRSVRTKRRNFSIQMARLKDEFDSIEATWFNQPFLKDSLKVGQSYIFSGRLNPKNYKPQVLSPDYEEIKEEQVHIGLITPIYGLTAGISNKWLRSRIKWLIQKIDYVTDITESLPPEIIKKYTLTGLREALTQVHFPQDKQKLKEARYRLAFEELLVIQRKIYEQNRKSAHLHAPEIRPDEHMITRFISSLEFALTPDQTKSIQEILQDLSSGVPMNRLLSGDVGSGKTIVAIAATLATAIEGYQVAILAPTTVLANQHFASFKELLKNFKFSIELITSESQIKNGKGNSSDIVIGTHSLLHRKGKLFQNLGLVIVDEQHRFGVEQREDLRKTFTDPTTNKTVHLLNMTATPIPRTLALTLFGNLEVSEIKTKPKSRQATKTYIVPEKKRTKALEWIRERSLEGVQTFWIAPLIEESEKLEVASVKKIYSNLKQELNDVNIELLHGKLKAEEKRTLLNKFRDFNNNKIHVLVSTSVIEVGIDIPNANVIVIEGAERFGLAQLHQLRGRVGRSDQPSWCYLFTSSEPTDEQKNRLNFFANESDGFRLAEFDLKSRGPGEVYGTRQSGIPNLKIASIFDLELVKKTSEAAKLL